MKDAARLLAWTVVALGLVLAPLGLPPFAMTLLTEAVILGLFAMSLDLMFGYTRSWFAPPPMASVPMRRAGWYRHASCSRCSPPPC